MNINLENLKSIIDPLVEFLKYVTAYVMGYLNAKKNDKIDSLSAENEELKRYNDIDKEEVKKESIYNAKEWK